MDGREEFAAKFDGSRENGVVLAGAAAHHLKEAVDLLNQGVEQVAFVVGEKIEMATERVGDRTLVGAREGSDMELAGFAGTHGLERETLDGDGVFGDGLGVALHERGLLAVEQAEQPAVSGEFGAEKFREGSGGKAVHEGSGVSASEDAETVGESWREMTEARPRPPPWEMEPARVSVRR